MLRQIVSDEEASQRGRPQSTFGGGGGADSFARTQKVGYRLACRPFYDTIY
jgi:hypothetical protein